MNTAQKIREGGTRALLLRALMITAFAVLMGTGVLSAMLYAAETGILAFVSVAAPIDRAVVGESARWGDGRYDQVNPARTRDDHWLPRLESLRTDYFLNRGDRVLNQFVNADLYPSISAPVFQINGENQYGGSIDSGANAPRSGGGVATPADGTSSRAVHTMPLRMNRRRSSWRQFL